MQKQDLEASIRACCAESGFRAGFTLGLDILQCVSVLEKQIHSYSFSLQFDNLILEKVYRKLSEQMSSDER